MFWKRPRISPLQWRKQLLVAESEINRARMLKDTSRLTAELRNHFKVAGYICLITASLAKIVGGLVFKQHEPAHGGENHASWGHTLLKVAGVAFTLWTAFKPDISRSNQEEGDAR